MNRVNTTSLVGVASGLILQSAVAAAGSIDLNTLQLNGNAAPLGAGVRLTPELQGQRGSAFTPGIFTLGPNGAFQTHFTFQISDGGNCSGQGNISDTDGPGADGIVFVVQNDGDGAGALGGLGGGLGYLGILSSVGAEFDSWNNGAVDGGLGNHVGVDTNGDIASITPTAVAGRFNDGAIRYAWVEYDGSNLAIFVDTTNVKPAVPNVSEAVDLVTELGGNSGYVGFTSGTGAACGNHDILSWDFSIPVGIDIKPGSDPNCFNINDHGVVPVAILGSADLDVFEIDLSSLSFAGLDVRLRGNNSPQCSVQDVNGDGFNDLVCQFEDDPTQWLPGDSSATLTGELNNGTPFEGSDAICVVP